MDQNVIEKFATNAVKDCMLRTGCIDPNISEGDKEPSWDGNIYLYKPGCTFSRSNLEGRVSVQVKGHGCENLSKEKINFDTDVADLKNYSVDGGVLYFVVYVTQSGVTRVYYAELTPARLAELLDQCTPSQKTKRIELEALPEDKDAVARIAREFREKCICNDGKRAKFDLPLVSALTAGSFVGRERELAQIEAELENGTNPIFITGLGGMGKTELAVKFGKSYQASGRGNMYMVSFQGSFYKTLMQTIAPQIPGLLEGNKDEKLIFDTVIHNLKQWSRDDILIIDNADMDEEVFSALEYEDEAYQALLKLPARLLITTRCTPDLPVEVGSMPHTEQEKPLYQLFRNQKVILAPEKMDALIQAVQGHTMTVDLIARTLKNNRSLKPERLIQQIQDGTIGEQDYKAVGTTYASKKQQKIDGHLLALFRVADMPEETKTMLSCAVLLPQGGMDYDTFKNALPETAVDALDAQIDHGWLNFDYDTSILTIHPVIKLVCRMALENWKKICPEFLTRLHEQQDEKEFVLDIYRQLAEVYIAAVAAEIPTDRAMWHYLAAWYLWKQGQYKDALAYEQEALNCREVVLDANDLDLAHSCNDIGVLYSHQGDHQKALKYKKKALDIRRQVLSENHPDLAISYDNVGSTYGDLGDHSKALEYHEKALEIRKHSPPKNHPNLAIFYNSLGSTFSDLGDYQKALEYHENALEILKQSLPENHPNLATAYNNVGNIFSNLGEYQEALEYKEKALEILKQSLPENHPSLAYSYNSVGCTYGTLGEHQRALEYQEKALDIRRHTLPENHPDMACSYNSVGGTYGCLGDHKKALEYEKKALEIRKQSLPENHPDIAYSYNNVGVTYGNLGNHKMELECKNKALEIVKQSLPENHPDIANSLYSISATYHNQAMGMKEGYFQKQKLRTALKYALEALQVAQNSPSGTHLRLEEIRQSVQYLKRISK